MQTYTEVLQYSDFIRVLFQNRSCSKIIYISKSVAMPMGSEQIMDLLLRSWYTSFTSSFHTRLFFVVTFDLAFYGHLYIQINLHICAVRLLKFYKHLYQTVLAPVLFKDVG